MPLAPTQKTAEHPLQKAQYAALTGALSATVVDHMPRDEALPVVVIGDVFDSDFSTQTTRGQVLTSRIACLSGATGTKEVAELKSAVVAELDNQRFDLSSEGFKVIKARYQQGPITRYTTESEGRTIRQANLEFEYIIVNVP